MKKLIFSILLLASILLRASDIYVKPGESIADAIRQARELRRLNDPSIEGRITIHVAAGNCRIYEPLFLCPGDSGTSSSPTIIKGEGEVIVSGGVTATGWKRQGKLMVVDVPDFRGRPLDFRQFYVNGKKAVRIRDVVDSGDMYRIIRVDKQKRVLWVLAAAVRKIQKVPYAEMVLHEIWCVVNLRIKDVMFASNSTVVSPYDPESRIQSGHPWPCPMVTTDGHNSASYLINARELLDVPGEQYHDIRAGKLYYYPRQGELIEEAVVSAVETLLRVEGTLDRPVRNIRIEGLTFSCSTWMRPSLKGHAPLQTGTHLTDAYKLRLQIVRSKNHKLDNQGWLGRSVSTVAVKAAQNIDFTKCGFRHLGSIGIDYEWSTRGGSIERCCFEDISGNGILIDSFSPKAREMHLSYDPADERKVCRALNIANNYVTDVTNEDWGTHGVCTGSVRSINIAYNMISEVFYTVISLGWGWNRTVGCVRNNTVHANLIHHCARHTYDVAGTYTPGSQSYSFITENCVHSICKPGYVHDPNHWFYLYTDEDSSFITVRDSRTEADKPLKNTNDPGNIWENNGPTVNDSTKVKAGVASID